MQRSTWRPLCIVRNCIGRTLSICLTQVERGLRCVLYTDLGNPTSNSIYRNIGYEAITETLIYGFA